ncbi:PREDICTED: collectrin isoform X4 [Chinchilla lanigera]|nr:PREDICTED: collectrin isoform X4 [Chinchilla lanigera]XP_013362464.1 PREDICTED: collectrin isoform X4 [Chinchilla lanigera]
MVLFLSAVSFVAGHTFVVLVDEEDRRYFKQQEIILWRKAPGKLRKQRTNFHLTSDLNPQTHSLPCDFHSERMLWLFFFLVTAVRAELCQPDAENAFKVRLSIRTALGDKAYVWDTNEEYLFRAMVAFSMRKVPNRETTEISHVLLCNVTQRVSFWFVVTDPSKNHTLPADEVQSAIRMNRNRINNVFFLNDQTLEFLKIPSTLAPPTDPSVPIWIIIFGVIFCVVIVATTLLILSGIRQRRRQNKESSEVDDAEDKLENMGTIANSIPCDSLNMKGGHVNDGFMTEDERLTPL